jgi:hypothetical protein
MEVVLMASAIEVKNIDKPDERRDFPHGHLELSAIGDVTLGRATFEPGWQWSKSVKDIAGTDSCQVLHKTYVISGRMHIKHEDGTEADVGPGDFFVLQPGHDAWTVGDEPVIAFDFSAGIDEYALRR